MPSRLILTVLAMLAWCAAPAHANLLVNGSFERASFAGWAAYGGNQMDVGTLTTPGLAREGAGVGVAETAHVGHNFVQDVNHHVLANRSYSLSMWVKSADGTPVKGTLALWGILHTESEGTGTNFTAGAEWTLITAQLNTVREHSALRAQVYFGTANKRLLVDGAQLLDIGLHNSSWELGSMAGWTADAEQASAAKLDDAARDGSWAAVVGSAVAGRSIWQDHTVTPIAGRSHTASVWVRSVSGQPVNGRLALGAIGGPHEVTRTSFTAGAGWTLVSATLNPVHGGHTLLRSQIVVDTPGLAMYADGAQLVSNELANAGFEQGFFRSWDRFPRGPLTATTETTAGIAREGTGYGAVRADAPGRSFAQTVGGLNAGQSRTFSAWLRSPTGARGSVVLSGSGGESGATPFYVGPTWTLVSAPLDATADHGTLTAEVVLDTPGAELDVDGASLNAGNARDNAIVPGPVVAAPPPAADADADGVPDSADACATLAGRATRRGCPTGLRNDTSISYVRTRRGIRVVRFYVEATKGARVVVTCSKGCRKTVTKGRGARRVSITRLRGRALRNGARITVTVSAPGRLTTTVVDRVAQRRRVPGRRTCVVPGTTKPKLTC